MKIKKIEVKNFKVISDETVDFNGCSAIITAGNRKGKTSVLKGLIDRMRGQKPEIIVKEGEEKGFNNIELTDGSRIEWKFTQKTESFAFITKEGLKVNAGVIKAIGEKYFGSLFDIDKFLLASSKKQSDMLARLVGIDFTEIDNTYKQVYEERTEANRELNRLKTINKEKPEPVEKPDIDSLKQKLRKIKVKNERLRAEWREENDRLREEVFAHNQEQEKLSDKLRSADLLLDELGRFRNTIFDECIDFEKANKIKNELPAPADQKEFLPVHEPECIDEEDAGQDIEAAYEQLRLHDRYASDLKEYGEWKSDIEAAKKEVDELNKKLASILGKKQSMIESANIPEGFKFSEEGLTYNGYPLTAQQLATSEIYIAALKLGSLALGDIKTLHFEASALDRNSLSTIEKWASDNDYQLLIERPDFEGGDIKYEIIES